MVARELTKHRFHAFRENDVHTNDSPCQTERYQQIRVDERNCIRHASHAELVGDMFFFFHSKRRNRSSA